MGLQRLVGTRTAIFVARASLLQDKTMEEKRQEVFADLKGKVVEILDDEAVAPSGSSGDAAVLPSANFGNELMC